MTQHEEKKPSPPLPKLRPGITCVFGDYDRVGKPYWMIHDPGRNKFFIIGWVEYQILEHWDLGDSDKIIEAVNRKTTLDIDETDIQLFSNFLKNHYLIAQSGYDIHKQGKQQHLFKKDSWFHLVVSYYLFFRIPLWCPDKFLARTLHFASYLFSQYLVYFMSILAVIAIFQVSNRWEIFRHTFSTIFTLEGLFLYFIAFSICKFCHEMGHAYKCKQYGIPVPSLGVAFLVFWPVLYTDTTLSWHLSSRKRLQIALAGIWVESYVTIIAALLWCNTSNLTIQSICYVVITINWVGSLLINVSPFMRFDGYYVLADYMKMPNLQPRAFALTRWQIRRWLFGWPDPPPEKYPHRLHYFLVTYSLLTWLYRLTLYIGIAILVYHFFIKIVGIILFFIEVYYFILGPIIQELLVWHQNREKLSWNRHTKISLVLFSGFLLFFFLPLQETVSLQATMSYVHVFLISPESGKLENKLPEPGTAVKKGEVIAKIVSPDLDASLLLVDLGYQRKISELRNSKISADYFNQKNIILSEISKDQANYQKLYSMHERLILKAPFDGIVYEVSPDLTPGTFVMKNEWIADLIQPENVKVEAYVNESDINLIKEGLSGFFYPHSISDAKIPVTVTHVDTLNTTALNCQYSVAIKQDKKKSVAIDTPCYHANELGGGIPAYLNEDGTSYVPVESVYFILLKPNKNVKLNHIERGVVVLKTHFRSYAGKIIYWLKKSVIEQSGF